MANDATATLKRTSLNAVHAALGAKLVPFAGYEMPVQYPTGITEEHRAVRERAGLFGVVDHCGGGSDPKPRWRDARCVQTI